MLNLTNVTFVLSACHSHRLGHWLTKINGIKAVIGIDEIAPLKVNVACTIFPIFYRKLLSEMPLEIALQESYAEGLQEFGIFEYEEIKLLGDPYKTYTIEAGECLFHDANGNLTFNDIIMCERELKNGRDMNRQNQDTVMSMITDILDVEKCNTLQAIAFIGSDITMSKITFDVCVAWLRSRRPFLCYINGDLESNESIKQVHVIQNNEPIPHEINFDHENVLLVHSTTLIQDDLWEVQPNIFTQLNTAISNPFQWLEQQWRKNANQLEKVVMLKLYEIPYNAPIDLLSQVLEPRDLEVLPDLIQKGIVLHEDQDLPDLGITTVFKLANVYRIALRDTESYFYDKFSQFHKKCVEGMASFNHDGITAYHKIHSMLRNLNQEGIEYDVELASLFSNLMCKYIVCLFNHIIVLRNVHEYRMDGVFQEFRKIIQIVAKRNLSSKITMAATYFLVEMYFTIIGKKLDVSIDAKQALRESAQAKSFIFDVLSVVQSDQERNSQLVMLLYCISVEYDLYARCGDTENALQAFVSVDQNIRDEMKRFNLWNQYHDRIVDQYAHSFPHMDITEEHIRNTSPFVIRDDIEKKLANYSVQELQYLVHTVEQVDPQHIVLSGLYAMLGCRHMHDYARAIHYYEHAVKHVEPNSEKAILIYIPLSALYGIVFMFQKALDYYERAKTLIYRKGLTHLVARLNTALPNLIIYFGSFVQTRQEALQDYHDAVDENVSERDKLLEAYVVMMLSVHCMDIKTSHEFYNVVNNYLETYDFDQILVDNIRVSLGIVQAAIQNAPDEDIIELPDNAEPYLIYAKAFQLTSLGRHEEAQQYYLIIEDTNDLSVRVNVLNHICQYHFRHGSWNQVNTYAEKMLSLVRTGNLDAHFTTVYYFWTAKFMARNNRAQGRKIVEEGLLMLAHKNVPPVFYAVLTDLHKRLSYIPQE
jgi:tetratricopeptide (TPR) repeat protein